MYVYGTINYFIRVPADEMAPDALFPPSLRADVVF